ncbi:hypothetical protein [Nereida sp. MMG025]|uniref:hypothetical protein n=1 Tax=Nereida sp. MMG025 TaxID=2909981 RepID=UPI001F2C372F|nr:hypothetical protein [Nereida sp. MMG025]MCF6446002.1 hypothetical protein [Nereida sp. MMG025]
MVSLKPVGRSASVIKYDLLTAMGAYALARDKHEQRLILRFMTLVVARYNWGRDELCVGQVEIARMWDVDTRTVKREMAKLRAMGWLVVRRQGARGRVTEYGLDLDRIKETTRDRWEAVGPDYALRMEGVEVPDKVVPLQVKGSLPPPDLSAGTEWALAQGVLHAEDAASYGSWLRALERVERAGGRLTLRAPTRFHAAYVQTHLWPRVVAACQSVDDTVSDVVLVV